MLSVWASAWAGPSAAGADAVPTTEPDDLPAPRPETVSAPAKVDLPAVPQFEIASATRGRHGPSELKVRGWSLLGHDVQVAGFITGIYDCAAALSAKRPGTPRAALLDLIERDPTLCESPKFYLGDAPNTPREQSLWVVDVPRPARQAERHALRQDQLKGWWPEIPNLSVGDFVVVTGAWSQYSARGEHDAIGVLRYREIAPAVPSASPAATAAAAAEPEIALPPPPALRKLVGREVRNASVDHLNACTREIAAQRYGAGIAECRTAVELWDGNHLAWYAWGSAHIARGEWHEAIGRIERAIALRPDYGMYHLYDGIARYEAERGRLDAARDALRRAIRLDPRLWRAHYYLGRVYRDRGDDRRAAEQFSAAIQSNPADHQAYVALAEVYHRWSYMDQMRAVAEVGTRNAAHADSAEIWFALGVALDAERQDDRALAALTQAILLDPRNLAARYQRGQIYVRRGERSSARLDLEPVADSTDPSIANLKQMASMLLHRAYERR